MGSTAGTSRRPLRTKAALAKAALTKAAPAKSTSLVELVPRSQVELVVPTLARYVVRIEGAELEVGDDFDAETVGMRCTNRC
jgi:anti-sigma factor RsiW